MTPRFLPALAAALSLALITPPACLAGPAPPLTEVYVYATRSTAYPNWVYYSPGAIASQYPDHGPLLQIAVAEIGYSSWRQAEFNGATMQLIQSIPIYNPYPYIVGYVQVFQYSGSFTSGTFTYEATSEVAPIRTLSTRFTIR